MGLAEEASRESLADVAAGHRSKAHEPAIYCSESVQCAIRRVWNQFNSLGANLHPSATLEPEEQIELIGGLPLKLEAQFASTGFRLRQAAKACLLIPS